MKWFDYILKTAFRVAVVLLFLFLSFKSLAFDGRISYLGIEQGLSNNSVRCIYQDRNGFMWFGTYDGLNRYDGYEFKIFRNKLRDTTSLPHNYIYCINEDLKNNLWVGTGQGIGIYNNLTLKFLPAFYYSRVSKAKKKITYNVNAIKTDAAGNIFIGANGGGLLVQNFNSDVATQLLFKKNGIVTEEYNVQTIAIDKNKRVWLFIADVGLCVYDYSTKKIQVVNSTIKSANILIADEEDNLWVGTNIGLYKYSVTAHSYTKSFFDKPGQLSSYNVASLSFDKNRKLWIGTEGGGINILDTHTEKFDYILPGESKNTLNSESVFAIYEDNEDRKWMGTLKGGVNKIDPQKNLFQTVTHDVLNTNSLINNFVSSFYEDEEKNLWIGTDGGGLSIWNRGANSFRNFQHSASNSNSLSNNSITCIRRDYLNNVWVATFGGGINKFNRATNTFEHYRCINTATGEENAKAWLLYEDTDKNFWATTFETGKLYLLNRQLNKFEVFDQTINDIIAFTEDRSGALWGGNSHELFKIDKRNKRHAIYEIGKPIRSIYEDKKGNFWIGTEGGGLVLFDRKQGRIVSRYSDAEGLCNNSVLNILEDNQHNLWLSTFNGLSKFNPTDKSFKNFYQDDGLQSNQFLYNSAFRLQSGEFAFGGIKGFNIFYPDSIVFHRQTPPVVLTGLRVNNALITADSKYLARIDGDQVSALEIPFNDAVLSFDFAALEYSASGKISYAYFLQNWDKNWNYSGNLRTANYTHLREGTYTLRVKSTNAEGVWNPKEVFLKITVLPPWYRSWWAYLFYAVVVAAAIYFYQRYRTKQTKLEYEVAIAKVNAEKERAELERERSERERAEAEYLREKAEHETERVINDKEKEINEKRLSFFTNVSHEFRTPLTLIINPIKDLINKEENGDERKGLNIVYRNARRLLSLVDQLLLFRKADTEADKLKISKLDFVATCREVYLSFIQQAKAKNIQYEFECKSENIVIFGDKEKIEIILFNLVSNALKYTPEGGRVLFQILENQDEVEILLVDNGFGISKEVGDKIFDRFFRVSTKTCVATTGFGIGLYLVKHFVENHKGTISYNSEPGKGTTFTFTLKKGTAHFGNQVIDEDVAKDAVILHELIEDPLIKQNVNPLEVLVSEHASILVVDDDSQLRDYVAEIFKDKFVIYQAESGEEGLRLAEQNTPDVIISDISMEGMSGIDLCKNIKESAQLGHIPVILLTGTSNNEIKLKGVEYGADDYITKPFEKDFLIARVTALLKSRNVLQNYFYNEITLQKNTLKVSAEYKEFLNNCIRVVEQHLDDDQFNIQTLASELGMSHSALYKKVKSISGQSVNGFIRFIRLRKAAELLITSNCNINEAALQVGMNDLKYFRLQFSKLFGMNPSEYLKKFRKPFNKNFTLSDKTIKNS